MKKKTVKCILAVITALSMMSSVAVMAKEENETVSQEDFLNDLKTGIEKRWEISDSSGDTASMSSDEVVEFDTNVVHAEYDLLKKYKDCKFDNAKFTMLADAYITALETQLNGIKYYKDSNSVYLQYWNAGYNSGSTDGVPGKLTNSAILQFEKDHGYAENTDITPELITQLEQAAQQ